VIQEDNLPVTFGSQLALQKTHAILSGHHTNWPGLDTAERLLLISWHPNAKHCKIRGLEEE